MQRREKRQSEYDPSTPEKRSLSARSCPLAQSIEQRHYQKRNGNAGIQAPVPEYHSHPGSISAGIACASMTRKKPALSATPLIASHGGMEAAEPDRCHWFHATYPDPASSSN